MAIDRESVLAAAQKFVEKQKYDKAISEYQKLLQLDPNDARTLLKVGDLQLKMAAYVDGVATYERVGKFYAQQGFSLKAIAVFKQIREIIAKQAPELEERYAHVPPKLAELYQQLGLISDALAAFDEVATRLQRLQRDSEAIEVFRKIVELDPSNFLAHLRLAEALSRARDADGAATAFGVAASLLMQMGRGGDALKVLERLLHHKPSVSHLRLCAQIYLERRTQPDAMAALARLQSCFQQDPRDLDTLSLLAKTFALLGQQNKTLEVHKEMARIAGDQGKFDLMGELVEALRREAPRDEGVQEIAASYERAVNGAGAVPSVDLAKGSYDDIPAESLAAQELLEDDDDALPPPVEARPAQPAHAATVQLTQVEQLVADGIVLGQHGEHDAAIDTLISAAEFEPRAIEVRVALRDVYLAANRHTDAVIEMLNIASLQLDALDGEGAAHTLQDIIAIDPANPRAAEMLAELGYELVEESPPALPPSRAHFDSYDPEAPLPSYDLDDAATRIPPAVLQAAESPLPSFPTAPESAAQFELSEPAGQSVDSAQRGSSSELEDALEEADFYASRGLYDDARNVLRDQLTRTPRSLLLLERIGELTALEQAAQSGSGPRATPRAEQNAHGDALDIASSLEALDAMDVAPEAVELLNASGQVDVEEVFAKFKEGVAKQIAIDDGQAHYDLGLAYREMGLTADAISEFQIAGNDPQLACICHSMVGTLHRDSGELDLALDAFLQGLAARVRTPEYETVLCYEVGSCYETKRMKKEALAYFQRVARRDPNYRDVTERIRRLSKPDPKPARAVAVGAEDDDFDRAFDELLSGGEGQKH